MAHNPTDENNFHRHLEITDEQEVVFCHECNSQWYRNQHGLICPACGGEITEIVSQEFDPRPPPPIQRPPTPPGFHSLRGHNPWQGADDDDSDPEEADIEEEITHGPGNSVIFTRTVRSSTPLRGNDRNRGGPSPDPDHVMRDFQSMINNLMGPQFRAGQAGRSGPGTLFGQDNGPHITGATWTFTTGGGRGGHHHHAGPPDDIASIFGGMFAPMGGDPEPANPGLPPALQSLQGLFAAMLNPANARTGDAVYTQEALDNIISTLMEQNPSSNAPGPAPAAAIAALPKKRLDEKMLGPEGNGECSVCMDDVTIGDEVVVLPCSHWFHEQCAGIWLKEHNTCPICRKGISDDGSQSSSSQPSGSGSQGQRPGQNQSAPPLPPNRPLQGSGRLNGVNRPANMTRPSQRERNAARLQSIRNAANREPDGGVESLRYVVGDGHRHAEPGGARRRVSNQRDPEVARSRGERTRRESERPRGPSRRTTSSSHSGGSGGSDGNGLVSSALNWVGRRLAGGNTGESSERNH